ncbi:MAG: histidinol dehydrogenase, partial [SAR202 cluster bacterium]|nr:histidinol dehydrogenase [SAR202 cluster bacterium]
MKIINNKNPNFLSDLQFYLESRSQENNEEIDLEVKNIISEVKEKGDEALFYFSKKFDGVDLDESNLLISKELRSEYRNKIDLTSLKSFETAIDNVMNFHQKQFPQNYEINENGLKTGSLWKPIQSVGLYVPGGKAVYPSSLIMNVVPAKIAGVKRIVVVTPNNNEKINPYILALLDVLDVQEVYQVGGAQAIAALAYGTKSIRPVNKIFGPGNAYVVSAKKQVFGKVGIDLIAGPSEIVVVADNKNNPDWVASDLIAQAEHDERSQSILITDSQDFSSKVLSSIEKLMKKLPKQEIIKKSLNNYGIVVILDDLSNAPEIIDTIAPEHLHLQNESYNIIFNRVQNAGGIFIGEYSSEAFGDYIVGTNHILPTSGSARFSSPLGVLDFMKRSSYVEMGKNNAYELEKYVSQMATIENLDG